MYESVGSSETLPVVIVTAGEAREFVRGLLPDESSWQEFSASTVWAGHMHRVALGIAVRELPNEASVDIIPLFVDRRIKEPNYTAKRYGNTEPERLRTDVLSDISCTRLDLRDAKDIGLSGLARALGYGGAAPTN